MKKLRLFLALLVFANGGFSQAELEQHILTSQGGSFDKGLTLDMVIGEPVVSQQVNTNYSINIGFLQTQLRLVAVKDEWDDLYSVEVFPNPFYNYLVLESDIDRPVSYRLFSSTGQLYSEGLFNNRILLSVPELPSGHYHLQVYDQASQKTFTLIK